MMRFVYYSRGKRIDKGVAMLAPRCLSSVVRGEARSQALSTGGDGEDLCWKSLLGLVVGRSRRKVRARAVVG